MKKIMAIFFFFLSFCAVFLNAQNWAPDNFLLIPVLETLFHSDLKYRPNWPDHFPPDAFLTRSSDESIILVFEEKEFTVKYDSNGRLLEFPYLYENEYAAVKASYDLSGALLTMDMDFYDYFSGGQSESRSISFAFTEGFYPFSGISRGGSLPVIKASADDTVFFIYIFESAFFLTETWYDEQGDMVLFCRASLFFENDRWRIASLNVHDSGGVHFTDYFYDSAGNVTEIRNSSDVFSALYRGNLPTYRKWNDIEHIFQWDAEGKLSNLKVFWEDDFLAEYRYEYEFDSFTDWVFRRESAFVEMTGLLVPYPAYNRNAWIRRINRN